MEKEKHENHENNKNNENHEKHEKHEDSKSHDEHAHRSDTKEHRKEGVKKEYIYNSDVDSSENISGKFWIFIGIIIILAIAGFAVKTYMIDDDGPMISDDENAVNTDKMDSVEVEFYVMSQCPYGTQVQDAIAPVLASMGDSVDFRMDFIARESEDGEFSSLHGQPEVDENIRQLCAIKYNPDEYMDYIVCQNKDIMNAEKNFEDCADEAGLDIDAINGCYDGEEGAELLSESIKRSDDAKATGSPTIFIGGEAYRGGRDTASFQKAICKYVDDPACEGLPACSVDTDCTPKEGQIPVCENPGEEDAVCVYQDFVEVFLVVVNDETCESCDTSNIIEVSMNLFPGTIVEEVDVNSEDGKALVEAFDLTYVPSYIFTEEIVDTYTWKNSETIQGSFDKIGSSYKIKDAATGATTFIDEDKRKEQEALLDNYPEENLKALGYDSDKPRLDYFVMAFCPYGNPADETASQLYGLFGNKVEIVPHYIVSVSDDKILSLHGEQEGNQGMRELCTLEELGYDDFFAFTLATNDMCSSSNADTCWEDAADAAGVDADAIAECADDRLLEIAREQDETIMALNTMYSGQLRTPSASPTFLLNGKTYEGGRDAESLKKAMCSLFDEEPSECQETIEASGTPTPSAGSC